MWNKEAQQMFDKLKLIMSKPPVLALPNFEKPFTIETDALVQGMGDMLLYEGII